jgi:hypothetical protein
MHTEAQSSQRISGGVGSNLFKLKYCKGAIFLRTRNPNIQIIQNLCALGVLCVKLITGNAVKTADGRG